MRLLNFMDLSNYLFNLCFQLILISCFIMIDVTSKLIANNSFGLNMVKLEHEWTECKYIDFRSIFIINFIEYLFS